MSDETRILAGILLLALVTVETGGLYLMKLWRSREGMTDFQVGFARETNNDVPWTRAHLYQSDHKSATGGE